ncbi:MAG: hypothetical protein A2Z25_06230 [Planctomycetes bacterium RBG_16_55_9]|nr:MAG: hypothetical protein A2Z25_06230 [Planctomycetes bacterium RBG_16_55_9]
MIWYLQFWLLPERKPQSTIENPRSTSGVFSVHPGNHRVFMYRGKPRKILTSAEHYGAVVNGDFDYDVYLKEMQRTGQNMTRVFAFYRETADGSPGDIAGMVEANTLAPRTSEAVLPFQRVDGHGKAQDGLGKFDLEKWNPAYFTRFKDFLHKCALHGVVCEVTFFSRPYNAYRYALFPSHRDNNINGVGVNVKRPDLFITLDDPSVTAFQERFIRRLVEELNEFDNVYYEICNEANLSEGKQDSLENEERKVIAWQRHMAGVVRQTEKNLPKKHLVAVNAHFRFEVKDKEAGPRMRNDDEAYFRDPNIDIINYHYISSKTQAEGWWFYYTGPPKGQAGQIGRFLRQRDKYRKPIVFDETFSGIVRGEPERYAINRAEAWEMLLSGGAGYNNLDWSFTPQDETGCGKAPIGNGRRLDGRQLREWFGVLRGLLNEYDLSDFSPATRILPEKIPGYGYAASTDNKGRYLLYFVDEQLYDLKPCSTKQIEIGLTLPAGRYSAQTLNPRTGQRTDLPDFVAETSDETMLSLRFNEDIALLLTSVEALAFSDITLTAGTGGPTAKDELGGHGAMFADVDMDGLPDFYITMIFDKPMPELFFRNLGNNVFASEGAARGIADFDGGSHGGCWADLDNDGDYDLVNGTTWDHPDYPNHNNIFRNNGGGTFTEVTPPCMRERKEQTRGVICFDADRDGDLDIFCVSGWMGSGDPPGERNEIYENRGGFNFAALTSGALYDGPAGQGVSDTDYDGDGDIDVIACNRDGDLNILRNDGGLVRFTKVDPSSIGIKHRAYSGVTTADLDGDGDLDMILVDPVDAGHLYRTVGDGTFSFVRSFSKVDGYMAGPADLDNDGDLDLVFAGNKKAYLNDGTGVFSVGPAMPVSGINDPRGIAFADIDNDGDLDFAVGVKRSRNWLVRNDYTGKNNWLKVRLVSPGGQAGAFGAKVRIYPAGKGGKGPLLGLREAKSNYGYLGQDDPVLHFGLGSHESVDIVITYLDGSEVTTTNIQVNQTIEN